MTLTSFGLYTKDTEDNTPDADLSMDFIMPLELMKDWKRCSLVADFFGNYQAYNYDNQSKVESVISTIANELLENAIKFTADQNKLVNITLKRFGKELILETVNMAHRKNIDSIHYFIKLLEEHDIEELFLMQIEKNALNDSKNSSGVGLLSIIKDYNAKIGIKIEETLQDNVFDIYIKVKVSEDELLSL